MRLNVDLANVAFLQKYSCQILLSIPWKSRKETVIQIIDEGSVDVVMFSCLHLRD